MSRWLPLVLFVALAAGATWWLRSTTMTVVDETAPGSRTRVVFEVETNGTPGDLATAAAALIRPCVLDVTSEVVVPLERFGEATFSLVLGPALDNDEARKLTGCLGDWRVPHVKATDIEVETRGRLDAT